MAIHTGKGSKQLTRSIKSNFEIIRGYYMVIESETDEDRYWFGETFEQACCNFDRTGNKYLNDKNNYRYWIAYCSGYDVGGKMSWANRDCSEDFIDALTYSEDY